jgi:hypothetical protein
MRLGQSERVEICFLYLFLALPPLLSASVLAPPSPPSQRAHCPGTFAAGAPFAHMQNVRKKPPAPSVRKRMGSRSHHRRGPDRVPAPTGRNAHLSPKGRRALELVAVDQRGLSETLLRTYGFTLKMLANIVSTGFATAQRQTVKAGGKTMEVVRIRITEAGRAALAAEAPVADTSTNCFIRGAAQSP